MTSCWEPGETRETTICIGPVHNKFFDSPLFVLHKLYLALEQYRDILYSSLSTGTANQEKIEISDMTDIL